MMQVDIINGPNLNLLGQRQPDIYGHETLDDVRVLCEGLVSGSGLSVALHQSNHEGVIVDLIQKARGSASGIVINPAAYSHTSVAILDALNAFEGPVVEVHISNIQRREAFRHHSFVSQRADGVISGCGVNGYVLALRQIAQLLGVSLRG